MPYGRHRTGMRRWVAVAAAYLLVLQAVLAGLASGAHAADRTLAQSLGMTLCSPLGSHDPGAHDDAAGQPDMMDHCRTVCALASNVVVPTSDAHAAVVYRTVDRVAFARQLDTPQGYVGGRSPANPRAPPSRV